MDKNDKVSKIKTLSLAALAGLGLALSPVGSEYTEKYTEGIKEKYKDTVETISGYFENSEDDSDGWGGCSRKKTETLEEQVTPDQSNLCKVNYKPKEWVNGKEVITLDDPTKTKGKYFEKISKDETAERLVNHNTAVNEVAINFGWRGDSFDRGDYQDIANLVDKCKELEKTCYVTVTGLASEEGNDSVNINLAKNRVNNTIEVLEMYAREKNADIKIKKSYTLGPTIMFDQYCSEDEFVKSGDQEVCRRNRSALVKVDLEDESILNSYTEFYGDIKLIDSSESMKPLWDQLKSYNLGNNEVYAFGTNFDKGCEMDFENLNPEGNAPLYDALIESCQDNPNRVIDVLTAGQDNVSKHSYNDVIKIAKDYGCTINAVTIGENSELNKIVRETKGVLTYFEK